MDGQGGDEEGDDGQGGGDGDEDEDGDGVCVPHFILFLLIPTTNSCSNNATDGDDDDDGRVGMGMGTYPSPPILTNPHHQQLLQQHSGWPRLRETGRAMMRQGGGDGVRTPASIFFHVYLLIPTPHHR